MGHAKKRVGSALGKQKKEAKSMTAELSYFGINLLVVYRESVTLIGYITRRLSADSLQL